MKLGINPYIWQRKFAWKPWKTIYGQWVWLEWVEVTGYAENKEIKYGMYFNCRILSTSFCVRLIEREV